jgi:hypothetical protein
MLGQSRIVGTFSNPLVAYRQASMTNSIKNWTLL